MDCWAASLPGDRNRTEDEIACGIVDLAVRCLRLQATLNTVAPGAGAEAAPVLQALPVVPGRRLGEVVELTAAPGAAPLKAGDKLVLKPAAELHAGQPVRVAPAATAK